MDSWQTQFILDNLRDLTEYIRCSSLFVAELTSKNVLSLDDNVELNAEPNRLKKSKYLLEVILSQKNGYIELLKALHETTQTGARDILLIGVLCNLKLQLSSRLSLLKEYLTENEIKQFHRQLSSTKFEKLYSCLIEFIENDQPFQIVKHTIPEIIPYYIPRILCKRLSLNPEIFKQPCPDIFVVSGSNRNTLKDLAGRNKTAYSSDQLDEITAQVIVLEDEGDWDEIQELNALKFPIHLIEYETENHKFILKQSEGASNLIRRFIETEKEEYDVTIKEEQFMCEIEKEKCKGVCICDLPGMGKTLLIENLARQAEKERKNIVAFVRLQHFVQFAFKCSSDEPSIEILLEYLSSSCAVLSVCILKKVINEKDMQMDIFFDGFDEIGDKYLHWTERFLKYIISQKNIRLFVTSRPHMRDKLQDTLRVLAYDILPFNETNQIDFFTNFWLSKNPKQDPSKLKEFANFCLEEFSENIPKDEQNFAGLPLICQLIAEIYIKHAYRYTRKNVHLKDNWISFGKSMFDIYKMFFDTKFPIKTDSGSSLSELKSAKEEHYQKALMQIFPDCAKTLENVNSTDKHLDKAILSYGLLHEMDNGEEITHQFIHRTIAEFLVAEYAVSQLANLTTDSQSDPNSETIHVQRKVFIQFLFENILKTQHIEHGRGMSVSITNVIMPRTYFFNFVLSTVMYFLDHQLKLKDLPKNVYNVVSSYKKSTKTHIDLTQLMESCGYQNLVNVMCLIENVSLISPEIEVISQVSLCETMTVIFQFSNMQFVRKIVEFVQSYFSFSLNEIVEVCTKNRWLTPLQFACIRRMFDILDYFLEESCSIEEQCLIHFCVASFKFDERNTQKRIDMIERLINLDAKLLFEKDVRNGTSLLCTGTDTKLIKFLIEKGADIFSANKFGFTIGHFCVASHNTMGSDEFQEFMLFLMDECKATQIFKMKNCEGNTPVYEALATAKSLRTDTLDLMLSKTKINLNEENWNGNTLIFAAVLGEQSCEILSTLIERGANYKVINDEGENLLHVAAKAGNVNTVEFLLTLELDPDHKNKNGETPSQLANCYFCTINLNSCEHKEILMLLQNLK